MVDPPVAIEDAPSYEPIIRADAVLKNANGSVFQGVMWPGPVVYPDWLAPGLPEYWDTQVATFFNPETGVNVDAIWIDMNDVSMKSIKNLK